MKTSFRILILLYILSVFPLMSFSQPGKSFSTDPVKFIEELEVMFNTTQNKDQKDAGKALMIDFSDRWLNNKFSKLYQDSVFSMCNIMLSRKMKNYPHFFNYLSTVILYEKSSQSEESFKTWTYSLRVLAKMSNSIRFMALIDATNSIMSDNILYETNILNWKITSSSYTFRNDSLPYFEFSKGNLIASKKNDSAVIYDTKGIFYPTLNLWIGNGGKILWERAGLDPNDVYAELFEYSLSTQKTDFSFDSVRFYNYRFFDRPLLGSLEEKVQVDVTDDRISYPRFVSFSTRYRIDNIFPNIDYEGGFTMKGSKLIGSGDNDKDAYLYLKRSDTLFVKVASKTYIIRDSSISSDRCAVSIFWQKDSIYHPGLQMRYNQTNKELSLLRDDQGLGESPYFNTFHRIDMYFEALYWKMDEPKIDMKMMKGFNSNSFALFESDNYYSDFRYEKLRGMEEIHPLYVLRDIATEKGSKTFTFDDVQKKMRVQKDQIIRLLITFAKSGFIMLDIDDELVTIKDRVYHYLNSKNGKTDYDVIQFNSTIAAQANATLNLLNFDLKLRGVPIIYLSDSQNVFVLPENQELVLKKNRDFSFDGEIRAGLFTFYVKNGYFRYDKFKFDLPGIDSISLVAQDYSQAPDGFGVHPFRKVQTVLQDLNGEILIDDPGNKSGLKKMARYPIFNSLEEGYVYYDKSYIYDGVYSRDKFYYRLLPFTIDTLDSYYSERKEFNGYLVSAGIFDDISEPLSVQPDFSLGFVMTTPEEGVPVYGGKGVYDSVINLSYEGLRGKGNLKYLTSEMKSDDILFFPDSLHAQAQLYVVKEKKGDPEYPGVVARDVFIQWYPYSDRMKISQKTDAISLFNGKASLLGSVEMGTQGLTGEGKLSFEKVEMMSDKYIFEHHSFQSDTTDVIFKTPDLEDIVLQTNNFNVNVDFQKQVGKFKSNDENSRIKFPFNNYACVMYDFDWDMKKNELKLESSLKDKFDNLKIMDKSDIIDMDLKESEFISEHPAQDSLRFYAPTATYNLNDNIIYATDVPVILVADAAIFPDSGKVTILKKAEMLPLTNADLIANVDNKKHNMYGCKFSIETANLYSGQGSYLYVDENDKEHKIFFSRIYVDSLKTRATGQIAESADFTLSPDFGFFGDVKLTAEKDNLYFSGGTRIKHDCDTFPERWMRFSAEIDPLNIMIPVENKPSECTKEGGKGSGLGTGLYNSNDSTRVYAAFLQYKRKSNDQEVVDANGFLTYNREERKYYIKPEVDSSATSLPVYNMISFDKSNCLVNGNGVLSLVGKLGRLKMNTYGSVDYNMNDLTTKLNMAITIDFPFDETAMSIFNTDLSSSVGSSVDVDEPTYVNSLKSFTSPEKADEILSELSLTGQLKGLPDSLLFRFYLVDVNMEWRWKNNSGSFVSDGTLGVATAGNSQIFRYVPGYIEIAPKRSATSITVYFDLDGDWYYFNYYMNRMQALSSNVDFVNAIKVAMAEGKHQFNIKDNEQAFSYILSTEKRKNDFLKNVKGVDDDNINDDNDNDDDNDDN